MVFWPRDEIERMLSDKECQAQGWNQNILDQLEGIIEAAQIYQAIISVMRHSGHRPEILTNWPRFFEKELPIILILKG